MRKCKLFLFPFFLMGIMLFISCDSKKGSKSTPTSGSASIYVDQTFESIIDEEVQVFESIYPQAHITPHFVSETQALNALLNDSTRFIVCSRPLTARENRFLERKKLFPRTSIIATDGIALVINRQNRDSLITVDQLRQLLTGTIKDWNQIAKGSTLGKVKVLFDNQGSSTVRYLLDSLCKGKDISPNISALHKNQDVIRYVAGTPNALGVIGISWISNPRKSQSRDLRSRIRVMAVSDAKTPTSSSYYQPDQSYLLSRQYPLYRSVYTIITDPESGLPTGFASFLSSDRGQRIILKSEIAPAAMPVRAIHVNSEMP